MKRLLLDIYKTNKLHSGLGQFSLNFHNAILKKDINWELEFLAPTNFKDYQNPDANYRKANFQSRYFPSWSKNVDLWHSLQQFPSHQAPKNCLQILTIHDLNFLLEKGSKKADGYLKKLQDNVDRADVITSISEFTSEIIRNNLDLKAKEVHTIHNGIYVKEFPKASKPKKAPADKFFFSIGIFSEKKNFLSLLPLLKEMPEGSLVIAGDHSTAYGNQLKLEIKSMGMEDRILLPGKISDQDKYWYYKNCEAFLFPSLAEGFGMPVIEAMTLGKAVFCSDQCSLPEIGGNAAFYWDNFDPLYMKKILNDGLDFQNTDKETFKSRQKEHAALFSWEACIGKYLKLYDQVAG